MRFYFKEIIYQFLELMSASANLACALVGRYPGFCWGIDYLASKEFNRIASELESHMETKQKELNKADTLKAEAESLLDVRD